MKKVWLLGLLLALCLSMAAAELPEQLTEIGESAFEGDAALTGVVYLPDPVKTVGARAFAGTSIHGLVVPEGCESLAADVLAQGCAAYVTLNGAETEITASALTDVPFIFAPAGGSASGMKGFYALETLCVQDGFFYSLSSGEALPLCAVDGRAVSGVVILPKLVDGQPLRQLDTLLLKGCDDMTALRVPSYLTIPDGMTVETYAAMTLTAPVPSVTECTAGDVVTWTTEISGAYGDVSYIWLFNTDGVAYSTITSEPEVSWTTMTHGECVASVTAIDALGDRAEAQAAGITVGEPIPVYRALLIGNTYPGTEKELEGCDTDVEAMRTMLNSMTGINYSVTVQQNVNSSAIRSAIGATFADARYCDVSLFYFSGHGGSDGSLIGVGNSVVTVSTLRSWLDAVPGTKVVIIDCCYSGMMIGKSEGSSSPASFTSAFISGFSSYTKGDNLATNGYIVMTACTKSQMSQTLSDGTISFGAFTYGVCYGSGYDEWHQKFLGYLPADEDSDGQITLGEAYSTAVDRVDWLEQIQPAVTQSAQYYGDTSFVLWGK